MIDFKKLKEEAKTLNKAQPLFAVVLGTPAGGKSSLCGTLKVPTLFLHTSLESHGPINASASKDSDVTPFDITVSKADGTTDPDATYNNLLSILRSPDLTKHFKAVCVDSVTELEQVIRKSKLFADRCKALSGKHNTYAESPTVTDMLKDVVEVTSSLHKQGMHIMFTCAAATKVTENSDTMEVTPVLQGYGIALEFLKNFHDVLLVARVTKEEEDGTSKTVHALVFKGNISRVSKDLKGQTLRSVNFSPRVSGLPIDKLPDLFKADLDALLKKRDELIKAK